MKIVRIRKYEETYFKEMILRVSERFAIDFYEQTHGHKLKSLKTILIETFIIIEI